MSPTSRLSAAAAERAILDAADELFYASGINAVSMAEIRDHASVSLRRLYELFPSKSDLVLGWLRDRDTNWLAWFGDELDQRIAGGADVVDAVFDTLADWLTSTNFRGCAFLNTLSESADLNDRRQAAIQNHKQATIDALGVLHPQPEALAVLIDGAIAQCAVFGSLEPLAAARSTARLLSEPATAKGPAR